MNTVVENTGINSWVAGDTSYKINRRKEYGNDAKSVQVGTVRKARIFNTQQVDQGTKARIEDQIRNFALEVEGAGEEAKRINEERKRIKAQVQELDREKHALTEDKAIKQKRLREWYSLEAMIG